MEKLSDFLGHKPQPEGNGAQNKSADFISPRKLQPNESLIEKLRGSPANHTADYERGIDRLVQELDGPTAETRQHLVYRRSGKMASPSRRHF